jgi:hypothetical protein
VGTGFDDSGPDGRGTDPAGIGYPAPDLPPISLIGTIGSTGRFFLVGSASTRFVDDAEGTLSLGVNDFRLGDNWGPGYTCTVTRVATVGVRGPELPSARPQVPGRQNLVFARKSTAGVAAGNEPVIPELK